MLDGLVNCLILLGEDLWFDYKRSFIFECLMYDRRIFLWLQETSAQHFNQNRAQLEGRDLFFVKTEETMPHAPKTHRSYADMNMERSFIALLTYRS